MRYLVKINDIKEKISYFEKQLDNIEDNIKNIENINGTIFWEGVAAESFKSVIYAYSYRLRMLEKMILSSIEYLVSFCDKYGSEYERLRNKYSYLLEEDLDG